MLVTSCFLNMPSWQCLQHCWVVALNSHLTSSNLPYSNAASWSVWLHLACSQLQTCTWLGILWEGMSCLLYLDLHVNKHICDCAGVCSAAGLLEPGYGEMARHAHSHLAHHQMENSRLSSSSAAFILSSFQRSALPLSLSEIILIIIIVH